MFKKLGMVLFLFLISTVTVWAVATSDAYYQAGNKLYMQGNYDLCLKYYKAAIQVDPQNWKAYQALGSCEYHMGLKDDAIRAFNQSLALNPNNPPLQGFVNRIQASAAPPAMAMPPRPIQRADALPNQGSITWNLMIAGDLDSYADFSDYYGSGLTGLTTPVGVEFGLGADYTISPSFQVGLNLEGIYKNTEPVSITNYYYGYVEEDQWVDLCWGPAVDVKYLIPIDRHYTFVIRGELGYYLLASSLTGTVAGAYSSGSFTDNLSSSSIGGLIGVEVEWMRGPGWAVDFGLGYRFLNFSTINYSYSDTAGYTTQGIFKDANNGNAYIDFSGINFTTAIRFF